MPLPPICRTQTPFRDEAYLCFDLNRGSFVSIGPHARRLLGLRTNGALKTPADIVARAMKNRVDPRRPSNNLPVIEFETEWPRILDRAEPYWLNFGIQLRGKPFRHLQLKAVLPEGSRTVILKVTDTTPVIRESYERSIQAMYDGLTGLMLSRYFEDVKAHWHRDTDWDGGEKLALLLLDLQGLRVFNGVYGHAEGDAAIFSAAQCLIAIRGERIECGRIGGDEFACLVRFKARQELDAVVARITRSYPARVVWQRTRQPVDAGMTVNAQLGIAIADSPDLSLEDLHKQADKALLWAKQRSKTSGARDPIYFHDIPTGAVHLRALYLDAVEQGMEKGLLATYDAFGNVTGAEVLLADSVPRSLGASDAEEVMSNLKLMDLHVASELATIQQAITGAAVRRYNWAGTPGERLHIAVNVPLPFLLANSTFPDFLAELLEQTELPSDQVILEVTEETALTQEVQPILDKLHSLGVVLAIDDFGKGYSDIRLLADARFGLCKIDKDVVAMLGSEPGRSIVVAMIAMIKASGMDIAAEGVQNWPDYRFLAECGVTMFQGSVFGSPGRRRDAISGKETVTAFEQRVTTNGFRHARAALEAGRREKSA